MIQKTCLIRMFVDICSWECTLLKIWPGPSVLMHHNESSPTHLFPRTSDDIRHVTEFLQMWKAYWLAASQPGLVIWTPKNERGRHCLVHHRRHLQEQMPQEIANIKDPHHHGHVFSSMLPSGRWNTSLRSSSGSSYHPLFNIPVSLFHIHCKTYIARFILSNHLLSIY